RDDEGNPLELVHRDVSPPNILISRRGEVKVTDFGLAKARTQLERTDPGVVKGKFSYLSPEAATGLDVTERADVFALGVCIWEMLGGRRLFLGDTDYETVQAVSNAEVPSLVGDHPEVEPEFEKILLKSLSRDPEERFESAREFGDALAVYLFHHQMKVTSYDIANLVKATLERQKSVPPRPMMIDTMIQEELARFTSLDDPAETPIDESSLGLRPNDPGARPLDASDFVDPSQWFEGDHDVERAIEEVRDSAPAGATMGWLEATGRSDAIGVASKRAGAMGPSFNPPPRYKSAAAEPVKTFRPPTADVGGVAPGAGAGARPGKAPSKKPSKSKVVALIVALVFFGAAGVAAGWFFTQ
ncbi:MAG: serine/threonine protein kinase, partial [Myxococcales bacterium]|nr:serine/threonine protein kinase [Myxococcales bacterium]